MAGTWNCRRWGRLDNRAEYVLDGRAADQLENHLSKLHFTGEFDTVDAN